MNRYFSCVNCALIVFLLLILACCTKDNNVKEITVIGEKSSNMQAMQITKGIYEKKNNVIINLMPNTFEDSFNKVNNDFAYKTGIYDVVLQYNFSLSSFVRNSYVYNIDDLTKDIDDEKKKFEKDLFDNAWKEVGFYYKNGDIGSSDMVKVGYPFAANTMLLVYNKEMFDSFENKKRYKEKYGEELDVPKTWREYYNIAQFFTNPDKKTYGICMQGASGGWLYYEYCCYLYSFGGKVFDKNIGWEGGPNTKVLIGSRDSIKATKYYKSLKPFNAGNYFTVDATEQVKLLKNGNIAMAIVWSDYLYDFTFDLNNKKDIRFGYSTIPGSSSPLAGGSFFVNKDSKHPHDAVKYIMYLMQDSQQVELAKRGLCSPLKSTYDNPDVRKIPYSDALKASLERGVYMFEAGPESELVSTCLTNYIQKIWKDELSVEDGLDRAREDILTGRKEIYSAIE